MNFFFEPLTLLTFFPLLGVLALLFINSEAKSALRWTALATSLVTLLISLWAFFFSGLYNMTSGELQLVAQETGAAVPVWWPVSLSVSRATRFIWASIVSMRAMLAIAETGQ